VNEGKLRKLIQLFQDSDIDELEVQHSFWRGTRIRISRGHASTTIAAPLAPSTAVAPSVPTGAPNTAAVTPVEKVDDGLREVLSPMVGTFYRASSPEIDPFVREGAHVDNGQTVCIIEAMKIMNEIPTDVGGEIVEILVENAQPVEYNQPLFKIRPSS
jgi:acetyl-CoA carboxylase biotin carboxyl carrier protein